MAVDLSGFSISLFCVVQLCMFCRYGFIVCFALFMLWSVVRMVRSSAYMIMDVLFGGLGMSDV